MKKTSPITTLASAAIILLVNSTSLDAATHTWVGEGPNGNWDQDANWLGGTRPTVANHNLIFSGNANLTTLNNLLTGFSSLEFGAEAGSFVIGGDALTMAGQVTNHSTSVQTINLGLRMSAHRVIDTGIGGITVGGGIGQASTGRSLTKFGTGTLRLSGANTYTGATSLGAGKLILDANAGGSWTTAAFTFGATGVDTELKNQGGSLQVIGTNSGSVVSVGSITVNAGTGANGLIVSSNGGSGTVLNAGSLGRSSGQGTLNVDLSSAGSVVNAATNLSNDIYNWATVTDGVKTGFLTSVGGAVARYTGSAELPDSGGNVASNYSTSGDLALTGDVNAYSIAITGAGSMTGNYNLATGTFLMEEGVGDYTITTTTTGHSAAGAIYIHQYSENGTLTLDSTLNSTAGSTTNNTLIKTGPGAFAFKGNAPLLRGATDIQSGLFQNDGDLGVTSVVRVRDTGALSGSGTIGGGTVGSVVQYTPVTVYSGGTLVGTNDTDDALHITGSLTLNEGATFKMDLHSTANAALNVTKDPSAVGPVVNLAGDLLLTLDFASTLNQVITLLTSDGEIAGTFTTVNGEFIPDDNIISLTYNAQSYDFLLSYNTSAVTLTAQAIPEPGSLSLILGGLLIGGIALRNFRCRLG